MDSTGWDIEGMLHGILTESVLQIWNVEYGMWMWDLLLANSFKSSLESALEDYIEASVILEYI